METDSYKLVYSAAIKLLTRRDYSRYKLSQKLLEKGHSDYEIDQVINELVEKKFLREDYYIEARIKGLLRKNYGVHYILKKLHEERIECSHQFIEQISSEIGLTAEQQISQLVCKKILTLKATLTHFEKKVKILTLLQNKGHDIENARPIVSKLLK
jgi:regulatory protein